MVGGSLGGSKPWRDAMLRQTKVRKCKGCNDTPRAATRPKAFWRCTRQAPLAPFGQSWAGMRAWWAWTWICWQGRVRAAACAVGHARPRAGAAAGQDARKRTTRASYSWSNVVDARRRQPCSRRHWPAGVIPSTSSPVMAA